MGEFAADRKDRIPTARNVTHKGTVLIASNTHWHSAWQSANSVASGLAGLGYQVIYVEPIPKRWPRVNDLKRVAARLIGSSQHAGEAYQPIPPRVTLVAPITLPDVGTFAQLLNRLFFLPWLTTRLRRRIVRPLILVHGLPVRAAISLQNRLKPETAIYRCVYDWSQDPHSGRPLAERDLLEQVDMAWADCDHNLVRVAATQPRAHLMPQAVDLTLFEGVSYTQSSYSRPLCVYFGTLGLSVDVDLLRSISHQYPLRLVGPVRQPLDGFDTETEIVGAIPHEQVPDAIRDADVLLLPYGARSHMRGVVPAKLFECLATGKPIVATNLPSLDDYGELVYLCDGHDAVLAAIEASRTESESLAERRMACARQNTWAHRIDEMERQIQRLLSERG